MPLLLVLVVTINLAFISGHWAHAEGPFVSRAQGLPGYAYNPGNRREPFRSMLEPVQSIRSPEAIPDTLGMTKADWNILGIISSLNGNQAMLQNTKGQQYIVSVGDVLSDESVRVVRLTNTTVILEYFPAKRSRDTDFKPQTVELTFE